MKIVLLCHPAALGSMSMPRFAHLIGEAMMRRGHQVEYATSKAIFSRIFATPPVVRKWFGYLDQFLIFPLSFRDRVRAADANTLFVVTDQALGMWVPMVKKRPHVIHCHDFLAQKSAMGEFPENSTKLSGRCYQKLIRRGYRQGRAFLSVSKKTQEDLHRFLTAPPALSEVIYNPLNYAFSPLSRHVALEGLGLPLPLTERGFILHVGGNQWYKNRVGVVAIYHKYCEISPAPLPLFMIGSAPGEALRKTAGNCVNGGRVEFLSGLSDREVHCAYAAAAALLYPSLEEGFGWPIAEAQASGCPVLTTDHAPMTEVGGGAAIYVPRLSADLNLEGWATDCGKALSMLLNLSKEERALLVEKGISNAARFYPEPILCELEAMYRKLLFSAKT